MSLPKSVIVVAPECSAELVQKLLESGVLPPQTKIDLLLPPGDIRPYTQLRMDANLSLLPSPGRRFFSPRHVYWLWANLRPSENNLLLVDDSPYRDTFTAAVVLSVLALSGKPITLLYNDRKAVIDFSKDSFPDQWLTREFNSRILVQEIDRLLWDLQSGDHQPGPADVIPLDASPEGIEKSVDYALGNADLWINSLRNGGTLLRGKRALEIGPGVNFGTILTLACYGAEVAAVERFSAPWDYDYHPKFYGLLKDRLAKRGLPLDLTPLDKIISAGEYSHGNISVYTCPLEELAEVPDQSIDLVFSNAVLEHFYDPKSAFSHLARITRPGGLGLHQVDFRDHRDFSKPLEHLLLSDKDFYRIFHEKYHLYGNRFRPAEVRRFMEVEGFEVKEFQPNLYTEQKYLTEFLVRLRHATESRYCDYSAEDLRYISGLFLVERKRG